MGKGTLALDLARLLNCQGESPPCGDCSSCRRIGAGLHPDVQVVAPARTEIGIEQIREIASSAYLSPFEGRGRVYILDGVERLSLEAANCFLKTLEEPPPQVLFLLLTSAEGALLPTIISRCQRLELRPLPQELIAQALRERWGVEESRAQLLAHLAQGCLGWAVGESAQPQREGKLAQLQRLFGDMGERFSLAAELAAQWERARETVLDTLCFWKRWWQDLLLVRAGVEEAVANIDQLMELRQRAAGLALSQIRGSLHSLEDAQQGLRNNANPRLALEALMLSLP